MTKPANPYAFPGERYEANGHITYQEGMTLRDYFAGQALVGMGTWVPIYRGDLTGIAVLEARAKWAYQQADAMIAAREGVA